MKTRSAKNKGRRLQNWACEKIAETFGENWGEGELIQSRPMGHSGVDVILLKEMKEKFPFSVECKNTERCETYKFIEQAKKNAEKDWLVIHKKNRSKPIVVLDAEVFFQIIKEVENGKKRFPAKQKV